MGRILVPDIPDRRLSQKHGKTMKNLCCDWPAADGRSGCCPVNTWRMVPGALGVVGGCCLFSHRLLDFDWLDDSTCTPASSPEWCWETRAWGACPQLPQQAARLFLRFTMRGRAEAWQTGTCRCGFFVMFYLSIFELTLTVGSAGSLDPPFHRSVGLKAIEWGPASEIYSLCFLERIHLNRNFVGNRLLFWEQVSSRKLLRRVFPKELLPISTCYFV